MGLTTRRRKNSRAHEWEAGKNRIHLNVTYQQREKKLSSSTSSSRPVVAVTGATGFTGGHVVKHFLERGYRVHATVRDPLSTRCDFLRKLPLDYPECRNGEIQLFQADLTVPGSFDAPFRGGVTTVVHVAAVTELHYHTCPFKEIIQPSIDGCREIARSAEKCGVKRIVFTSSGSVVEQQERHRELRFRGRLYCEEEHRIDLRPEAVPYVAEKVLSEMAIMETFSGEVVSLLPTLIIGPQLSPEVRSSQQLLRLVANRESPLLPRFYASWIDVRDVAMAHRLAAEMALPSGRRTRRYIISSREVIGVESIAASIDKQFPKRRVPTRLAPWPLMWLASWFDKRLTNYALYELAAPRCGMNCDRAAEEWGFERTYTSLDETVRDAMQSFFRFGIVV